jgi:hypothetical protein
MYLIARRRHDLLVGVTLSVDVWVVDETDTGKIRILEVPEGDSDLAGFEVTRTKLWGSPVVRSLGAALLPQLAEGDLWVSHDLVEAFAAECARLLANLAMIAAASGYGEDYVQVRLTNMLVAARRAFQVGGGVVVW